MAWNQMVMDIFDRIGLQLEQVLEGLTPDELNRQPAPGVNTIGWLTWHLTRSHDRNIMMACSTSGKRLMYAA